MMIEALHGGISEIENGSLRAGTKVHSRKELWAVHQRHKITAQPQRHEPDDDCLCLPSCSSFKLGKVSYLLLLTRET